MDREHKILVIDDDPIVRKALLDSLTRSGYKVLAVATGKAGIDAVKDYFPSVVIIDLNLLDMNGMDVLKEIKSFSFAECILLTGHSTRDSAIEAVNFGACGYLLKPYNIKELISTIEKAIKKGLRVRII